MRWKLKKRFYHFATLRSRMTVWRDCHASLTLARNDKATRLPRISAGLPHFVRNDKRGNARNDGKRDGRRLKKSDTDSYSISLLIKYSFPLAYPKALRTFAEKAFRHALFRRFPPVSTRLWLVRA